MTLRCRSKKHVEAVAAMRAVLEEEEGLDADAANNGAAAASNDEAGTAERVASDGASPGSQADSGADESPAASQEQRHPLPQQQPHNGERRGKKKKKKRRNQRHGDVDEGTDSDAGSRQQAAAPLDPLAAELEALGLAGKPPQQSTAAADSDATPTESQESELDEEAMLERLVGSQTQAAEASGDSDAEPAEPIVSGDADARDSDAEAAGSDGEGEGSAAEGTVTVKQGAKSRRAKVQGRPANEQASAVPLVDRSSAAAAEQDGKPMTKRQKRKQKGGQTAQAGEVPEMACGVCGLEFESRTQLFKHIASSGHALLKA